MKSWTVGNRNRREVDLNLNDNTVSGLHAILTRTDDGRWMVKDCDSTNGTARFANGKWTQLREAYVLPDDRLRFGRTETTVRRLLALTPSPQQPAQGDVVPWTKDLIAAFSEFLSLSEAKKNLLFVPDLITSPSEHIIRCAYRRQPVNPFCFMVFSGVIYTMIAASGLSVSGLISPSGVERVLQQTVVTGMPKFIAPLTLTLLVNMFGFWVFAHFSSRKRSFHDFMRMTAVLSGMSWMLQAFVLLLVNEHPRAAEDAMVVYCLAIITVIYMIIFNLIGYKHFWKMSYARAAVCSFLTGAAACAALIVIILPLFLINGMGH